jgi:hypothetical protein
MRANHEPFLREQKWSSMSPLTLNDLLFRAKRTDGRGHHFGCSLEGRAEKMSLLILAFKRDEI